MSDSQKQVSRREFIQTTAMAAGVLGTADAIRGAAPAADIKIGLYSITYGGVWYSGGALTVEQVIQRAKKLAIREWKSTGSALTAIPSTCRRRVASNSGRWPPTWGSRSMP